MPESSGPVGEKSGGSGVSGLPLSGGALLSSNPRGANEEGFADERYACFWDLPTWRRMVDAAGFVLVDHYYRPAGKPRHQQPWLATVWHKSSRSG